MQAIEERLRSLSVSVEVITSQKPKNRKDKLKQDKEYQLLAQQIEALELYQQFKIGDWVTDWVKVGQIVELSLSPGGMPQVWVKWDEIPLPEQPNRLNLLGDNWAQGWKVGDRCLERGIHPVTIIRFGWYKNTNQVEPLVEENGIERFTSFNNLTPSNDLCDSLTFAPALAAVSHSPESSPEALNSWPCVSAMNGVGTSWPDDSTPKSSKMLNGATGSNGNESETSTLTSSQLHLPVSPSQSKDSDEGQPTNETVSPPSSERSQQSGPNISVSRTFQDCSVVPTSQVTPLGHISETFSGQLTSAGMMRNGLLYQAVILEAPSLEKDCSWLESPGALSKTGNGRPPGQTKLEAQLKNLESQRSPSTGYFTLPTSKDIEEITPSKPRRRKGEGSGSIHWKTCKRKDKSTGQIIGEYSQPWYHYEIWSSGDRLKKGTTYIPQKLLAHVEALEEKKAPVKEILKLLGVNK